MAENLTKSVTYSPSGDTLYWDGNTEGLTSVKLSSGIDCYHVSSIVPTFEDLSNGYVIRTLNVDGTMDELTSEIIPPVYMGDDVYGAGGAIIVAKDEAINDDGIKFPKKGVYFIGLGTSPSAYIESYTITGYTGFKEIKIVAGNTLFWNGNTVGRESVIFGNETMYRISESVPTIDQISESIIEISDGHNASGVNIFHSETHLTVLLVVVKTSETNVIAYTLIVVEQDNVTTDIFATLSPDMSPVTFPKKGLYTSIIKGNYITTLTIPDYTDFTGGIITYGADTITWNGNLTGLEVMILSDGSTALHLSDAVLTEADLVNNGQIIISTNNSDIELAIDDRGFFLPDGAGMIVVSQPEPFIAFGMFFVAPYDNYPMDTTIFKKGLWWVPNDLVEDPITELSLTINGFTDFIEPAPSVIIDGNTITWNGDSTGLETFADGMYVRITDYTPSMEDFSYGKVTMDIRVNELIAEDMPVDIVMDPTMPPGAFACMPLIPENVGTTGNQYLDMLLGFGGLQFIVLTRDIDDPDIGVMPKGIYVIDLYGLVDSTFEPSGIVVTITDYHWSLTIEPSNAKFARSFNFGGEDNYYPLPIVSAADDGKVLKVVDGVWSLADLVRAGSDILYWDGNTEGLYRVDVGLESGYHVSNAIPTIADLNEYTITMSNGTAITNQEFYDTGVGILVNDYIAIVTVPNANTMGITFEKAGVYFVIQEEDGSYPISLIIPGFGGF